jgi:hypothetical protein
MLGFGGAATISKEKAIHTKRAIIVFFIFVRASSRQFYGLLV